jgi:hypothetical protein
MNKGYELKENEIENSMREVLYFAVGQAKLMPNYENHNAMAFALLTGSIVVLIDNFVKNGANEDELMQTIVRAIRGR